MNQVLTGLDVLHRQQFQPLRGRKVGLVTHAAAIARDYATSLDLIAAALGGQLKAVFGPEHGLLGQAQDLIAVSAAESGPAPAAARLTSLYGDSAASLRPTAEQLEDVDVLVIDLQDVGARYYTFQATMLYCLEAAAALGKEAWVLDRPNPLGGRAVEGPRVTPGHDSFVSCHDIAIRHGLTIGELARLYAQEKGLPAELLTIVPCQGLQRDMLWGDTGLPWVLPSPNMPTPDTAAVYPGLCLLEGTNLSEGRGVTRPFEICGAPWLDAAEWARRLNACGLPGVWFRPLQFRPSFHKHAGQDCGGVQLHITDARAFTPVRAGLALLALARELSDGRFAWRTEAYEFVEDPIAIDLLFGSGRERQMLESEAAWEEIPPLWEAEEAAFAARADSIRIYD